MTIIIARHLNLNIPLLQTKLPLQNLYPNNHAFHRIIMKSPDWRKIAPIIFSEINITPQNISAKMSSNGNVLIKTPDQNTFRLFQKIFHRENILFFTHNLPEEHSLMVVLKGIPTDITVDEVINDLTSRGFDHSLSASPLSKETKVLWIFLKLHQCST